MAALFQRGNRDARTQAQGGPSQPASPQVEDVNTAINGTGSPPPTSPKPFPVENGDFYLTAEPSGREFCFHAFFLLRESPYFREQLGPLPWTPRGPHGHPARTMKLTVSEEAISLLLRIFYNPTYSEFSFNTAEWASVLEFAHGYEFEEVKKLALRELEKQPLDVADRIQLYEEQKADVSLVIPYYFDISTRPHILSRGEARTLGLDASLTIHECREHSRVTVKKGPKENGAAGKRGNAGAGEPVVIEFDHSIVIAHLARCLLVDPAFVKDRLTKTNRIPGSDQPAA